jgi:hypothetical protein
MAEELLGAGLADLLDLLMPANVKCRGPVAEFSTVAYAVRSQGGIELHFTWPPGMPRAILEVSEGRAALLLGPFRVEIPEPWAPELWARISGAVSACETRHGESGSVQ